MNGTVRNLTAALAAMFVAEAALAQAGSAGPAPGSTDSKAAVRDSQETNAEFNRQIGAKNRKARKRESAVPATAADLVAGSAVRDQSGVAIGTIESVDATGVIVASPVGKVKVPVEAFGKDKAGLLMAISKADFDTAVAQANAAPNG